MSTPISPSLAGADFASRLVSNVYGLHKQQQDEDRATAEKSRQSMLNVLEAAAQSGDINPADKPVLYQHMFDLIGAKSKDVAAIMPHIQSAFSAPNVPRAMSFNHDTVIPAMSSADDGMGNPVSTPAFSLPPVPTTTSESTPAIRLMNPSEKAAQQAKAQAVAMQTLYPEQKRLLDEANDRKLQLQGAKLSAQEQSKLGQILTKGRIDASKKLNSYIAANQAAGYDPEAARGLAGKQIIREEEAATAVKEQQEATGRAREASLRGMLDVHKQNAATLSRRADILVKQLQETVRMGDERIRHNKANEATGANGGAATARNIKVLTATTKELYTSLTAMGTAIGKLEGDKENLDSDGNLLPGIKVQVDALKKQRDSIQTKLDDARTKWLPSMPEPTVTPEVPQAVAPSGLTTSGFKDAFTRKRGRPPTAAEIAQFETLHPQ